MAAIGLVCFQVAGMRIQLTYDGADSSKPNSSVWRCIDALDIFPLGWCGSQGGQIVPPPGKQESHSKVWYCCCILHLCIGFALVVC